MVIEYLLSVLKNKIPMGQMGIFVNIYDLVNKSNKILWIFASDP